jgi:aspartate dehydrogenase
MVMLDVGVVGMGAIGSKVARRVVDGGVPDARLASVSSRTQDRVRAVVASLGPAADVHVASDPAAVAARADVVVEAAGQDVVEESAVEILERGADLVVLSVGAFRDEALLRAVRTAGELNDARVRVPSGAVGCLDAVGALGNTGFETLSLRCYRPPAYLEPYVDEGVALDDLEDGAVIFDGTAAEAAAAFPAHMNVAIALTLAARVDPGDVAVQVAVDRDAPRSRYVVEGRGRDGGVEAEIQNVETDEQPPQSGLTVNSVVETLRRVTDPVVVGT